MREPALAGGEDRSEASLDAFYTRTSNRNSRTGLWVYAHEPDSKNRWAHGPRCRGPGRLLPHVIRPATSPIPRAEAAHLPRRGVLDQPRPLAVPASPRSPRGCGAPGGKQQDMTQPWRHLPAPHRVSQAVGKQDGSVFRPLALRGRLPPVTSMTRRLIEVGKDPIALGGPFRPGLDPLPRSEERRVGKECRL